jgi:hypothetical protein
MVFTCSRQKPGVIETYLVSQRKPPLSITSGFSRWQVDTLPEGVLTPFNQAFGRRALQGPFIFFMQVCAGRGNLPISTE